MTRRLFGAAGLATVGAALLGPKEALAQPPQQRRKKARRPRNQRADTLAPIEGLELALRATPTPERLILDVALLHHGTETHHLYERKWRPVHPKLSLRAFGQDFALTAKMPAERSRRAIMSRSIPMRTLTLLPRDAKTNEPSRLHYATFHVDWPEALRDHLDDLRQVPALLTATLEHYEFKRRGVKEPLRADAVALRWDADPVAAKKGA